MLFLILSSANVNFLGWELRWRTYTTKETFLTTRRVELIGKKEFVAAAFDPESETFIVYIALLRSNMSPNFSPLKLDVYSFHKPQVSSLITKEALIKILVEYSDFADKFFPDLASKCPKYIGINNHAIELVNDQQLPYGPIYSLGPIELKTLKAYIETNLRNRFIKPSKSLADAPILFNQKSNNFLRLCINYQGLNNLTIKNRYPLLLIGESLTRWRGVKYLTQLNLTSVYHWIRIRKDHEWKTVFKTRYSHFKYQVMLFSPTNASTIFQKYINKILVEKLDIFSIVYLNDFLIYTKNNRDGHITAIE